MSRTISARRAGAPSAATPKRGERGRHSRLRCRWSAGPRPARHWAGSGRGCRAPRSLAASASGIVDFEEQEIAAAAADAAARSASGASSSASRSRSALIRAIRSSWIGRRDGESAAIAACDRQGSAADRAASARAIRAISSALPIAQPTRAPARPKALDRVRSTTRFVAPRRLGGEALGVGEFDIGLVEDDDRLRQRVGDAQDVAGSTGLPVGLLGEQMKASFRFGFVRRRPR